MVPVSNSLLALLALVTLNACLIPAAPQASLAPGEGAIKLSTALTERSHLAGTDALEDFESQELGLEVGLDYGFTALASVGHRGYDPRDGEAFDTTEYSLALRQYWPAAERVNVFGHTGARYGNLPGSREACDLDLGTGVQLLLDGWF